MKRMIFSVLVAISALLTIGCSSTLMNVERDSSLDRVEMLKGEKDQDGHFAQRQETLAEQEIRDREVAAEAKRGYKVLVVNESADDISIEIKKHSWFFINFNPITAKFIFYGRSNKEHYLMPGKYDVSCYTGCIPLWTKTYEVTTAPQWDDNAKSYYHCVMGDVWVPYYQTYRYRHHY
ncbi:MAG: hypothetical protein PHO56_03025 [Patescibacteria group bacterium]|nr:hypothetical protein [Patescibacteria group bacterium]